MPKRIRVTSSKSSTELSQLRPADCLAVAWITRAQAPQGRFRFTYTGDGVFALRAPGPVLIYRAPPGGAIHAPSELGLDPRGTLTLIHVLRLRAADGRGTVDATDTSAGQLAPEAIVGSWLCLPRDRLAATGDLYAFQLVGCPVAAAEDPSRAVGKVTAYFETGAHGILEVALDSGASAVVPFIAEYCSMDRAGQMIAIADLEHFVS